MYLILVLTLCSIVWNAAEEDIQPSNSTTDNDNERMNPFDKLQQVLKDVKYDNRIRPNAFGETTNVTVSVVIRGLGPVDEKKFVVHADIFLTMGWIDPRLNFNDPAYNRTEYAHMTGDACNQLWQPDLYFLNGRSGKRHSLTQTNNVIVVYPFGGVQFSQRLSVEFTCHMNLKFYPKDTQRCPLIMESFSHSSKDILFKWIYPEPVTLLPSLDVAGFVLNKVDANEVMNRYFNADDPKYIYSRLTAEFVISRAFQYYLFNVYLPSSLLVLLTWASFFVPLRAVPARVTLVVTNLLSTLVIMQTVNRQLNKLEYRTYLDYFVAINIAFILSSMVEFIIVLQFYEARNRIPEKKEKKNNCFHLPVLSRKQPNKKTSRENNLRYDMVCGLSDRNNNVSTETRLRHIVAPPGQTQDMYPLKELHENEVNDNGEVAIEDDDGEDLTAPPQPSDGAHPIDFYTRILFPCFYGLAMIIYYEYITDQPAV